MALVVAVLGVVGTSSSSVCASCHAMRPYADALARSKHAGVSCYSCHLANPAADFLGAKLEEFTVMYPAALIGGKPGGAGTRVASRPCLACHEDIMGGATASRGYRITHVTCASRSTCGDCHSATAHGKVTRWVREPVMEQCTACHTRQNATVECDACHAEKGQLDRLAKGPWQVTHGPNWRKTHGMGDAASCVVCHRPDYCRSCHGTDLPHPASFGGNHGAAARAKDAGCRTCHDEKQFCLACHGYPMPHPASFLKTHPGRAKSDADPVCMRCHYKDDCIACHVKHTHPGRTDGTYSGVRFPKVTP